MTAADIGRAYDGRSEEYTHRFGRVEDNAVEDRELIGRWGDSTSGLLLDAGCGPGHWAEHLARDGRPVVGVDVSEQFLAVGRRSHPTVPFVRASLGALPLPPSTVGGVLAWYSTIHTAPDDLPSVLGELARVVHPGGSALLGFVDGDPGTAFAHSVVTAYHWSVETFTSMLATAGFDVVEQHRRQDPGVRAHAAVVARRVGP